MMAGFRARADALLADLSGIAKDDPDLQAQIRDAREEIGADLN
jgi:hypothetical protein